MNKIKPFLIELFEILNKDYNYAVLRSFDGLPDNFNSHDIDIIFDKNQIKGIRGKVEPFYISKFLFERFHVPGRRNPVALRQTPRGAL